MRKLPPMPRQEASSFLMVPQVYIDKIMPGLLESEWRVLLVILRQTWGWISPDGLTNRKERDWISMGQFCQKAGLHRESVSHAVQSLIGMGLIQAETEARVLLTPPELRRRNGSRVYYRLTEIPGGAHQMSRGTSE